MRRIWLGGVLLAARVLAAEGPPAPTLEEASELYRRGKLSQSAAAFTRITRAHPLNLQAWKDLAAVNRELGRTAPAVEALRAARKLAPLDAHISAELGWILYHRRAYAKAQGHFDEALIHGDQHAGAMLGAAVSRLAQNSPLAARPFLERLKEFRPHFAPVYYFLGLADQEAGRLPEAIGQWTTALQKDWTFAEIRLLIARAYDALGDVDAAWSQYARYLNTYAENRQAYERQQSLLRQLTKKPADIISYPALSFTAVANTVLEDPRIPVVRIGLNTDSSGQPLGLTTLVFRFAGPFRVTGASSGQVYVQGAAEELWQARLAGSGELELIAPGGRAIGLFLETLRLEALDPARRTFMILGVPADGTRTGWGDREYRGDLELTAVGHVISPVNRVNVESYLLGVVPAEVPAHWPPELLKAQAVIARNQTLLRRNAIRRHRRYHYDLCDSQHCQVYKGVAAEDPRVREAVLSTRGEVVYHRGRLANTLYHSTCGGVIQRSSELNGWYEVPYLQRRLDADPGRLDLPLSPWEALLWIKTSPPAYCNAPQLSSASEFRWLRIVEAKDLDDHLRRQHIGKVRRILPVGRTAGGHVRELWVEGTRRTLRITRENLIRYRLASLRSTLFLVETHLAPNGEPASFWFYGGGWGHSVGFCQTGAAAQASAGKTHAEIIPFYYPGATLHSLNY